jgi:hypothetical protein
MLNPGQSQPRATKMWQRGPNRLFAKEPFLGGRPYSAGGLKGYVGAFVCDKCRRQVQKVLGSGFDSADWLCTDCAARYCKGTGTGTAARSVTLGIET